MLHRAPLLLLALLVVVGLPASASGAVPDKWVRWVNVPDQAADRTERDAWVRSLDFIGPALYAGTEGDGVFASGFAAGPWTTFNSGFTTAQQKAVRQVVAGGGQVYAATTAGLFRTQADNGNGWQPVGQGAGTRKLNMGGIQTIHFPAPPTDQEIVVGTASSGVLYSSDNGASWDKASGLPAGESVFHFAANPAVLYAAAADGVYASLDKGRSWTLASDGIPPSETVLRVVVTPDQPNLLYASTSSGIYKSTNAGVTWNDATGSGAGAIGDDHARALLAAPSSFGGGRFIAGTEDGAWATRDDGVTWGQMSPETLVDPDPADPAPDPLPFGQQILWALNVGFGGPEGFNLMAGTQASGIYAIALQKLENTADPTISAPNGLKTGEKLIANNGTWTGTRPFFFSYQWRRCNNVGSACADIPGATAKTYSLDAPDDLGKTLRVVVTGKNIVPPDPAAETSAQTAVVSAPAATVEPTSPLSSLSPSPNVSYPWGQTFTINEGSWRVNSVLTSIDEFSYEWFRCSSAGTNCQTIANTKSYTSVPADVGKKLKAFVTAREGTSSSDPAFVAQTFDLIEKTPVNTEKPRIVGDAFSGRVLSSSAGAWTANQPRFERRWLRCEADGLGCNPTSPVNTSPTYTLTDADLGKRLQLEVKAIVEDPNQDRVATAFSETTPVITTAPPEPVDPVPGLPVPLPGPTPTPGPGGGTPVAPVVKKPTIRITAPRRVKVGSVLRVPAKVKGFSRVRYQWYRGKAKIRRATRRTYKVTRKDRGKALSCRIVLTPAGGGKAVVVRTKAVKVPRRR